MQTSTARWPWIAPVLIYAVSALEMIIMISPAAAYFYSVYTPLFHGLEQQAATAWLPQFFLPHLAETRLPVFRWLSWLGAVLTLIGLLGFLACAIQLYYGKFVRKQLVSGGLYGRVRHPQYLLLAVAGVGLLLLWPRFFILVSFLVMLGLYYILARHEEELIRKRYGAATDEYLGRVPMFNPFARRRSGGWQPLPRGTAFTRWALLCAGTLAVAFLVRAVGVDQLYVVRSDSGTVTTLSLRGRPDAAIADLARTVLAAERPPGALFLQVASGSSQLKHLLIDVGMREDVVDGIASGDGADYTVVSVVESRDPAAVGPPDPLGFDSRFEPRFYARIAADGAVALTPLPAADFHPGFARIRF
jgi:protein-S-isoprenylcysteine O-methyltransferase Ste14